MTTLLSAAIFYAELGYPVFPCVPGTKSPLTGRGFYNATTDTEQIEAWWEKTPTANLAIPTEGLIVLDIDGEENEWFKHQPTLMLSMAVGAMSLTPGGGQHRWFKCPEGKAWGSTTGKIAPKVDTRGHGGYALVPPSIGENGKPYVWVEGSDLDIRPEDMPEPPDWLQEIFDKLSTLEPDSTLDITGGEVGNAIPSGQRNAALAQIAGSARRGGATRAEIEALLLQTNQDRCQPPLNKKEVLSIARSISRYEPDQVTVASIECHWEQDRAKDPPALDDISPEDPGEFPEDLLKVPGIIDGFSDFVLSTSFRPQPILALGAAISLMSVLTGHKVRDEYDTRTNVYGLGVAPSGGGKERARQAVKEVLELSGGKCLLGPEGFASHAGLVAAVSASPCTLFQVDEVGRMLRAIADSKNAPHLTHIVTNLMKLFSSSNSFFRSDAYADLERNSTIDQPHACLWGTTVPESFYGSLSRESVTDGFISRLMVFETPEDLPKKKQPKHKKPPKDLLAMVKAWVDFKPKGNLNALHPEPQVWTADKGAAEVFEQFDEEADARLRDKKDPFRSIWTRTVEKARKLSLIHICSRGVDFGKVDAAAAEWGCALSRYLTYRIVFLASQWVSENQYERKINLVLRTIAEGEKIHPEGVSATYLARKLRSMASKERAEYLENLSIAHRISKTTVQTGNKPKTLYKTSHYQEKISSTNSRNSHIPPSSFPEGFQEASQETNRGNMGILGI